MFGEPDGQQEVLTADEVSERYRGSISLGTLRNWRAKRIGPAYVKLGKAELYPIEELEMWEQRILSVTCVNAVQHERR
ncbi:helix-turn-helix domain-containing protein [Mesorhizobium sp. CO1-1-11]|nr:helix-turn-helix domain-containing protein [Mesorhizobium sp. CO1-1-11]MBZ9725844.1 helix-turn-helix domain-containing protein [Mesorhizobium sp. CO1-1-11]